MTDQELQTLFVRSVPKTTVKKIKDHAAEHRMTMAGVIIKLAKRL
jgi:hypothetical protein